MAIQGEVSKPEEIHRLFSEIKKRFGKVDVLVNNAGTYEFAPLESITREHMQKHFNLNITGLLLTSNEAVKLLEPDSGSVVNIGSASSKLRACGLLRLHEGEFREQQEKTTPLGRIATPEDIAMAATF